MVDDCVPPAFPVDVFPPVLQKFIATSAKDSSVPVDYMGVAVLAVLSTAIGNGHVIQVKEGWTDDARLWLAIIGNSASNKSGALSRAFAPLYKIQKSLSDAYATRKSQYDQEVARRPKDEDKPAPPVLEQVIVQDATMEAMMQVLQRNGRGVVLYRDELAAWVGSMNAYRPGADRETWLSLWNHGQPITVNRKMQDAISLPTGGFVTVVGGMPPGSLAKLVTSHEDGLLPRFLIGYPEPLAERPLVSVPVPTVDYIALVLKLWSLHRATDAKASGNSEPITVILHSDAYEVFREWHDTMTQKAVRAPSDYLTAAFGKMPRQCARLVLILHCCQVAATERTGTQIHAETMTQAIRLTEYFAIQAQRVAGVLTETKADHQVDLLVKWLTSHGGRTDLRTLYRENVANIKGKASALSLIEIAEDRGLVEIDRGDGKRRSWTVSLARDSESNTEPDTPDNPTNGTG